FLGTDKRDRYVVGISFGCQKESRAWRGGRAGQRSGVALPKNYDDERSGKRHGREIRSQRPSATTKASCTASAASSTPKATLNDRTSRANCRRRAGLRRPVVGESALASRKDSSHKGSLSTRFLSFRIGTGEPAPLP